MVVEVGVFRGEERVLHVRRHGGDVDPGAALAKELGAGHGVLAGAVDLGHLRWPPGAQLFDRRQVAREVPPGARADSRREHEGCDREDQQPADPFPHALHRPITLEVKTTTPGWIPSAAKTLKELHALVPRPRSG